MKMKKIVVGLTAGVLVSLSVATTAFAAGSPSTDKVVTPTPTPCAPAKETGKACAPAKKAAKKKGKSDKTGETVPVFPAAAAACLAGAALFGTKIKFEEE